jgi:branched-chain amino acid transport system permease protein
LTGVITIVLILLGITGLAGKIVQDRLSLGSPLVGVWALLLGFALWSGSRAARPSVPTSRQNPLLGGLLAGAVHGLLVALLVLVIASVIETGFPLRKWLVQLTPEAIDMLTLGWGPLGGALANGLLAAAAGLLGALWAVVSARYAWRAALSRPIRRAVDGVRSNSLVERFAAFRYSHHILIMVALVILLLAPMVLNRYWNYTLGTVGIYVMLGLGLNIVVGLAGLLDLGYVAFFAIGAYTVAILTAPLPHGLMLSFWLALPIGVLVAGLSGVLLGIPVLRMRGDYLAIVTLGFGEIIRILSKSDVLTSFAGGPQGIRNIGGPVLFGATLNSAMHYMYLVLLGIGLVAFVTHRLQNSRTGRAWMAMREDEDVASAMGVYTLKYKLLAFAIGAAFAGLGGGIYASRNQFVGPEDFTLMVSINVLCLVIIGGMGSIPGVVVGALVLKGLPEILRELDDYRMLAFGALLILMMIVRPEGLWPSKRRRMELHASADASAAPTGD